MSRHVFGCVAAGLFALTVGVSAQISPPSPTTPIKPPEVRPAPTPQIPDVPPQSGSQRETRARAPAAADLAASVTVEGCLMRSADIAGRTPNVAERVGVSESYVLTNVKMIKGTAPKDTAAVVRPDVPVGTSGATSSMYDVKGLETDRLKQFAGQRVQIDGKFDDLDRSAATAPTRDLVNIRGTMIRQASGDCSAK